MRVGLIRNSRCENIIVADDIQTATELYGDKYAVWECPISFGIGDLCYDGSWIASKSVIVIPCPQCGNYINASSVICPICNYEVLV